MTIKVIQSDRESLILARQICADHDPGKAYQYLEGQRDDYMPMTAVLAAFASHADPLRRALEEVMVGGNHLASILVRRVGADFAERFPPEMEPEEALRVLCATDEYDVWCCWRAIMLSRAALSNTQPSPAYSMEKSK